MRLGLFVFHVILPKTSDCIRLGIFNWFETIDQVGIKNKECANFFCLLFFSWVGNISEYMPAFSTIFFYF